MRLHRVLRVVDLPRMQHFHCKVLGRARGAAPGPQGRNLDHFCLRIEPFDEAVLRAHLARHGLSAGPAKQRDGAEGSGPSIYLDDPEGNVVGPKGPPHRNG